MNFFAKNLKWLRKQRGFSQVKMAKDLDFTRSAVANYENNFSTPDYDNLIKIAKYLDVTIDGILTKDLTLLTTLNDGSKFEVVIPSGVDLNEMEKKVDEMYGWMSKIKLKETKKIATNDTAKSN